MGKSKKKIKADQINILRKQYDAFLEEDKKRKERNEHILDKLDKIRLSNTVARYKPNVYVDQRVSFNCAGEAPIKTYLNPQVSQPATGYSLRKFKEAPTELDVIASPMDETYIINEISKKYILIPKLRSIVSEDYMPRALKQENNNDNDWKSKYSILDTLKQNEKEETNIFSAPKNSVESFLDDIPSKEPKYRVDSEALRLSKREFANTIDGTVSAKYAPHALDCLEDTGKTNSVTVDGQKEITKRQLDKAHELIAHISRAQKTDVELHDGINDNNLRGANEGQHNRPTSDAQGHHATKNIVNQRSDTVYSDKHEHEDTEKLSPVVNDIRHVEVIDSLKPAAQTTENDNQNTGISEKHEYPIDIINVQDFTPADGVTLVDGVNINPEGHDAKQTYVAARNELVSNSTAHVDQAYLPGADQLQGTTDHYVSEPAVSTEQVYLPGVSDHPLSGDQYVSEQITVTAEQKENVLEKAEHQVTQENVDQPPSEDFVASEIEAFEAEQNEMFYSEQANYQDQEVVDGVYGSETTNYDPNLYYTSAQQEAAYPVEINEHEETSQRYDPNYEEQYGSKGSEQEQYAQQQHYGEQQQYSEQPQYSEQQYAEQQYTEQQYGEQQVYADQQYNEQQNYAEQQQYVDQQLYDEQQQQQYAEQPYLEQQEQYQGDLAHNEALKEQQAMEQVEQQLNNEEFEVPAQADIGDIVDENVLYAEKADNVATHPYVENQNPQSVSETNN